MNLRKALGDIVGMEWVFDDDSTRDSASSMRS